jgi:hypothetical protein
MIKKTRSKTAVLDDVKTRFIVVIACSDFSVLTCRFPLFDIGICRGMLQIGYFCAQELK